MYKKVRKHVKNVGLLIKPVAFFPLSLPSPWSLLKLPFLGAVPQCKTAYVCPPMQNQAPRNNNFYTRSLVFPPQWSLRIEYIKTRKTNLPTKRRKFTGTFS